MAGRLAAMTTSTGPDLLLIRHGETTWSKSGQHTSRTDLPLTPTGEAQAKALGRRLASRRFALVLSSPRTRAVATARLAGLEAPVIDPDLAEWDYGDFEGLTTPQIQQQIPGWSIWTGPWPNGETPDQVAARADRVIDKIRAAAGAGETVVVVAHGHLIRVLAARWLGAPPDTGRWLALGTASLSELGWERTTPVIEHWNDEGHLDAGR
jgi:broad specificity phosphatase PhoE